MLADTIRAHVLVVKDSQVITIVLTIIVTVAWSTWDQHRTRKKDAAFHAERMEKVNQQMEESERRHQQGMASHEIQRQAVIQAGKRGERETMLRLSRAGRITLTSEELQEFVNDITGDDDG